MDTLTHRPRNRLWRLVAAGFGTGYAPWAAGTVASGCAVLIGGALLAVSPWWLALAALVAAVGGFVAIERAAVQGDPGWVVIDEFAGQWITLLALPKPSLPGLLLGFLLFRLFDIAKIGLVGWADRQHGTFGIMADDIIAGVMAALILGAAERIWPGLLANH